MYRRYGLWSIYLFAALPFPFDIIGIACGLLKIDVRVFFLMTWLGKMTSRVMLALTGKASLVIVMELISGRVDTLSLVSLLFAVGLMLASLLYWFFMRDENQRFLPPSGYCLLSRPLSAVLCETNDLKTDI